MAYNPNQQIFPFDPLGLLSQETQERMQRRHEQLVKQQQDQQKAWIQANQTQIKEEAKKFLAEWQKEYPLHDPNRSLVNHLGIFYQLLMVEYTPEFNEEIARLPAGIDFDTIIHDLGVLTFAVTLPKGVGDKELQKWAQSSFTLIDTKKGPAKESLNNLIWLVTRKMELAITTMQTHVKTVQAELIKGFEELYNDHSITDVINDRYEDHAKRRDILADEFSNLRKRLRTRFGDAEKSFKAKNKADFKLQPEADEEPEVPELAAEMGSVRLASEAFRD
ncbi:hypothetical protein BKA61DRAFT_583074 [Leptodontidium sp. MPI-SDFR-AT-0119]|nr:hypothetical protein BKA61DRAFT_583074 [Leptodontidium sp. MPI-SDFR-AT-0119]